MDKTKLVSEVAELFVLNKHKVDISVRINHREIDVVAVELQGLIPKTFLIEVADYAEPVGVDKVQFDERKLAAAREHLKESAVLVHVARNGYTAEASGYLREKNLTALSLETLIGNLINFTPYINNVNQDRQKEIILKEYQQTSMSFEDDKKKSFPSMDLLENWMRQKSNFLFVLGDYGVGKSWLLKRFLYKMLESYIENPAKNPLPILIPLQKFAKAFDFKNLILKVFDDFGLSGVHYEAFRFLLRSGRVVILLDSFDEMAQSLSRSVIRENLTALLDVGLENSRVIMTSRPTYFENKSERILVVERFDSSRMHMIDKSLIERQVSIADQLNIRLGTQRFCRLKDLNNTQRANLFKVVLAEKPKALEKLLSLLRSFSNLQHLSQRAVIARLLTTVAETLASSDAVLDINGDPLLPTDLNEINQAKIFDIVVYNLLQRDVGFGDLSAGDRLRFLQAFALYLQSSRANFFANPDEIREIVRMTFPERLRHTDSPEQELEGLYRTCRRHSGLTTEGQFFDTSGLIDYPVSEVDMDSKVGFSHNSLREYLVAKSFIDALLIDNADWSKVTGAVFTDVVMYFINDIFKYTPVALSRIEVLFFDAQAHVAREIIFKVILFLISVDSDYTRLLGNPAKVSAFDISFRELTNCQFRSSVFSDCLMQETAFNKTDLTNAKFERCIIERAKFDGAILNGANFESSEVLSIMAYDEFDTETYGILEGKKARQWLFSRGANVFSSNELNPLMGKPWYEAAREVTRTLQKRLVGTHQQSSLVRGTDLDQRAFAKSFVEFLVQKHILEKAHKSKNGNGWLVKVNPSKYNVIDDFSVKGIIGPDISEFFDGKH